MRSSPVLNMTISTYLLTSREEMPQSNPSRSRITLRYLSPNRFAQSPLPRGLRFSGFSLLEMMAVISLILILATFAMPVYRSVFIHAHEATLREDLFTLRYQIDQYTHDNGHGPASLEELAAQGGRAGVRDSGLGIRGRKNSATGFQPVLGHGQDGHGTSHARDGLPRIGYRHSSVRA